MSPRQRTYDADTMIKGIQAVSKLREHLTDYQAPLPSAMGAVVPPTVPMAMEMLDGYCLGTQHRAESPRQKRTFAVEGQSSMPNGAIRKYGKCPDCGTTVSHIVSGKDANAAAAA